MDMSDIRETESRIEVKAAAVSNLLNSINSNAFGFTLEGVLGNGSYEEQKQAAYNWMNKYYELVYAVIYSASRSFFCFFIHDSPSFCSLGVYLL